VKNAYTFKFCLFLKAFYLAVSQFWLHQTLFAKIEIQWKHEPGFTTKTLEVYRLIFQFAHL